MFLKRMTPNLMVRNVKQSLAFYRLIGFEMTDSVPAENGNDLVWASAESEDIEIMFQSIDSMEVDISEFATMKTPTGTFTLFCEVSDVDSLYGTLSAGKAPLIVEPHLKFYGMKEFTVKDPDGYFLTFAERVGQEEQA